MALFLHERNQGILQRVCDRVLCHRGEEVGSLLCAAVAKVHAELAAAGEGALLDRAELTTLEQAACLKRWNQRALAEVLALAKQPSSSGTAAHVRFDLPPAELAVRPTKREMMGDMQSSFDELQEVYHRKAEVAVRDESDERWRLISDKPLENLDDLLARHIREREEDLQLAASKASGNK